MSGTCTIADNQHGQRRIRRERDVRNGQSDISGDCKGCCDAARDRDRNWPWSWSGRSVHSVGSRRRTGYHGEIRRVGSYISRNTRGWSHQYRLKGAWQFVGQLSRTYSCANSSTPDAILCAECQHLCACLTLEEDCVLSAMPNAHYV